MKTTIIIAAAAAVVFSPALQAIVSSTGNAAPKPEFFQALHQVETSGRLGAIPGDFVNGAPRALGPLQIHRAYWQDSKVPGRYEDCADLQYSIRVVSAYLRRYARTAWDAGSVDVLARVHNGGPQGHRKKATLRYAAKVKAALVKVGQRS
jgi:hypothetical protein